MPTLTSGTSPEVEEDDEVEVAEEVSLGLVEERFMVLSRRETKGTEHREDFKTSKVKKFVKDYLYLDGDSTREKREKLRTSLIISSLHDGQ